MKRQNWLIGVVVVLALAEMLLPPLCSAFTGEGGHYSFDLPGSGMISDEDAVKFSKEILVKDGRFTSDLELRGEDRMIQRRLQTLDVTVCWARPGTMDQYFVLLERKPGKVEGVSVKGH